MKRINYHLEELRSFVAVATRLSFKAAAEELFISQPALSRRIDRFEEALGGRLFERTTRRVSLTASGTLFLEHARAAIETLEAGLRGISEGAAQRSGIITVASVPSIAHHWLPSILKAFSERFPNIRIRMVDGSASWVLSRVAEGIADLGVSFTGAQAADIDFRAIHTEHYVLAVRRDHKFAKLKKLTWADLVNESLITLSEESGNRILIEHALAQMKRRPQSICETNHVSGALSLVVAGLGVSVVPSLSLPQTLYPALVGIPLSAPEIIRTIGLVSRKGASLSPAAQALFKILQDSVESSSFFEARRVSPGRRDLSRSRSKAA